jgi:prepilin-type N-terminal cleavage/methylation domain-containing protein
MIISDPAKENRAFSLIELLIVMAILTILVAVIAPALSNTVRGHKLEEESMRFLAATEYARDEAISQGMAMTVWINGSTQKYGVDPQMDYFQQSTTHKEFTLNPDVKFDNMAMPANATVVTFGADGSLDLTSSESFRMEDRFGKVAVINRRSDGWGYEIAKGAQ